MLAGSLGPSFVVGAIRLFPEMLCFFYRHPSITKAGQDGACGRVLDIKGPPRELGFSKHPARAGNPKAGF